MIINGLQRPIDVLQEMMKSIKCMDEPEQHITTKKRRSWNFMEDNVIREISILDDEDDIIIGLEIADGTYTQTVGNCILDKRNQRNSGRIEQKLPSQIQSAREQSRQVEINAQN